LEEIIVHESNVHRIHLCRVLDHKLFDTAN